MSVKSMSPCSERELSCSQWTGSSTWFWLPFLLAFSCFVFSYVIWHYLKLWFFSFYSSNWVGIVCCCCLIFIGGSQEWSFSGPAVNMELVIHHHGVRKTGIWTLPMPSLILGLKCLQGTGLLLAHTRWAVPLTLLLAQCLPCGSGGGAGVFRAVLLKLQCGSTPPEALVYMQSVMHAGWGGAACAYSEKAPPDISVLGCGQQRCRMPPAMSYSQADCLWTRAGHGGGSERRGALSWHQLPIPHQSPALLSKCGRSLIFCMSVCENIFFFFFNLF